MKDRSFRDEFRNKSHREIVLLAVLRLGKAKSIEISNYVNTEMHKKISYRAVQGWLAELVEEGRIGINEYGLYFAIDRHGRDIREIARSDGKQILKYLFSPPVHGSETERIDEFINRVGFQVVFDILIPRWFTFGDEEERVQDSFRTSWAVNSIPLNPIFEQFTESFGDLVNNNHYEISEEQNAELIVSLFANKHFKSLEDGLVKAVNRDAEDARIKGKIIIKKISRDAILNAPPKLEMHDFTSRNDQSSYD